MRVLINEQELRQLSTVGGIFSSIYVLATLLLVFKHVTSYTYFI